LDFFQSGIFISRKKYFSFYLPRLWKFCVFQRSNHRGGKLPYRARSPPPFLGQLNEAGKESEAMQRLIARFAVRLSNFNGGYKNIFLFFYADFGKTAFSNAVIIRGVNSSASFPAGKEVRAWKNPGTSKSALNTSHAPRPETAGAEKGQP